MYLASTFCSSFWNYLAKRIIRSLPGVSEVLEIITRRIRVGERAWCEFIRIWDGGLVGRNALMRWMSRV